MYSQDYENEQDLEERHLATMGAMAFRLRAWVLLPHAAL